MRKLTNVQMCHVITGVYFPHESHEFILDPGTVENSYVHPYYIHPFTFLQSWHDYRPAEGCVEAKRCQGSGPPLATTNRLMAEPGGGP
jgi:hypothetical protein